ncbi:MAG: LOG family protein [Clostridia bacterium]|nr:LOG family protein [Clostridia bacterium]
MKVFIGGSVSESIEEKYKKEGERLVDLIVQNNIDVIACADLRGMIGLLYTKMKELKNNKIYLTLPKIYLKYAKDIEDKIDIITDTINERTDESIKQSDCCLFMPGGIGTIYEILSCIETKRAGEHNNKIVLVNSYGYYDDFIKMLKNMQNKGFVSAKDLDEFYIVDTVEEAVEILIK